MTPIYLDHAATTPTDPALAEQVARDLVRYYANPSSAHAPGREAGARLAAARAEVEALFPGYGAVFTASGSEALNLAIKGAWDRPGRTGTRIVISAVEHPAVRGAALDLAAHRGAEVALAPVHGDGRVDLDAFAALLTEGAPPAIVAVMAVQNELGTVEPLDAIGGLVRERAPDAFFVVDAVQAIGKIPVTPVAWSADAFALSSHKVHGPKRTGALLLRSDHLDGRAPLRPGIHGGGQERGLLSGTEGVAYAAGFAAALTRAVNGLGAHQDHLKAVGEALVASLRAGIPDLVVNGPVDRGHASPAIVSVAVPGLASGALLQALSDEGIFISAGSACHAGAAGLSRTQRACGFDAARGAGTLRFGISFTTTAAEVEHAAARAVHHVARLRPTAAAPAP